MELLRLASANQAIPWPEWQRLPGGPGGHPRGVEPMCSIRSRKLLIAEIPLYGTPFVGRTLEQIRLSQQTNLAVIGLWERGVFGTPAGVQCFRKRLDGACRRPGTTLGPRAAHRRKGR
ncbi:MAG: hypothetical protein M0C28_21645 [Candidatus Moduliflexus flocculans]|nr:hypothetical protein [Candidatus Moduliflexus flocculans]